MLNANTSGELTLYRPERLDLEANFDFLHGRKIQNSYHFTGNLNLNEKICSSKKKCTFSAKRIS